MVHFAHICAYGVETECELWRQCVTPRNVMTDVYDANVWKEFRHLDNHPYLVYPSNFCLSLNIDWFNPFKENPYSALAIKERTMLPSRTAIFTSLTSHDVCRTYTRVSSDPVFKCSWCSGVFLSDCWCSW